MGFFSWRCKGCGQGVRNFFAREAWAAEMTLLLPDEEPVKGVYDGYGRIHLDAESDQPMYNILDHSDKPEVWHTSCWIDNGSPKYSGPSESDPEQGHFGPEPTKPEEPIFAPPRELTEEEVRNKFLDQVWSIIGSWHGFENKSALDRTEGTVFSILAMLDG